MLFKKSIFPLLFICFTINLFSQDLNKALEYFDNKEYENAVIEFEKCIPILEKELGVSDTTQLTDILYKTAFGYKEINNYDKTIEYYKKGIEIYKMNNCIYNINKATLINNLGLIYLKLGNYSEAEVLLLEALKIIENKLGKEHPDYAISLNNIARLYTKMGNYAKAELLYLEALKIKEESLGKEHPAYATSLNNLGSIYLNIGNYAKAEPLFVEALKIRENKLGKEHPNYVASLNNLALLYSDMGNYSKSEPLYVEALKITENMLGKEHLDYAISLNNLALLYSDMGNYSKSVPLYVEALKITENTLGKEHPDYVTFLSNLAQLYLEMGNFREAEHLNLEVLSLTEKLSGKNNSDYATSLNNLALLYSNMGDYSKSEPLYLEALKIRENKFGKEHPDYAISLNNLALLYSEMGIYLKAEPLYLEALKIIEKSLGKEHPYYATSLNNIARLYSDMGDYSKSEPLYLEALKITENKLIKEHPAYATSLNNLALLYSDMGDYSKAGPLLLEALKIREKSLGKEHPDYAISLNNLAYIYNEMGNYTKAEPLFLEALNITEKSLGKEHPDYAIGLNNLALLYSKMGNYKKSEPLYLEALKIREKSLGKEHPDYAISLNNLAYIYNEMGNYTKAEPLFLEALNITEKSLGKEHPEYATILNNLALLYSNMGDYSKAESLYLEALKINEKAIGKEHPNYATSLNNLALMVLKKDNFEKAIPLYIESLEIRLSSLKKNFSFLSELEKKEYLNKLILGFEVIKSVALIYSDEKPSIVANLYNYQLALKGLLLTSNQKIKTEILNSKDTVLIEQYYDWIALKSTIGKFSLLEKKEIQNRAINLDSLEEQANSIEKELSLKSNVFAESKKMLQDTWQDVQNNLKPDEAAIEFIDFDFYDKRWTDTTYYCALVLRKDYNYPKLVKICTKAELLENIHLPSKTDISYSGKELYNLVWKPIDSLLQNTNKVYVSMSGLLHKLSFTAFQDENNKYLGDKYNLYFVSSTRKVINSESENIVTQNDVALFGGIQYDLDSAIMLNNATKFKDISSESSFLASNIISDKFRGGASLGYLEGTYNEVVDIENIFKTQNWKTSVYSKENGSEEAFKSLSGKKSPQIIHIATHGYFYPDIIKDKNKQLLGNENKYVYAENPLFRSGLAMAGSDRVWNGKVPFVGIEDGILTAYEVANTWLGGTDLVVLSACETGLGDIKSSEGVYGLQRSFFLAGAKKLIMSLWKVPDQETYYLMKSFYTNYLTTGDAHNSLKIAQKEMIAKGYDPYFWAGFVLIE